MDTSDEGVRARLEGRLETLERALTDLRAVLAGARSLRWRARLNGLRPVVASLLEQAPALDEALVHLEARAARERWPKGTEAARVLAQGRALRRAVLETADRRAGGGASGTLRSALERLGALAPGQALRSTERLAAAARALEREAKDLEALRRLSASLDAAFGPPGARDRETGLEARQLDALEEAVSGEAALERLWARLRALDARGAVERALRRRGPLGPDLGALEVLRAARVQHARAHARLDAHLEALLAPLTPGPEERLALARWSLSGPGKAPLRLPTATAPRVALLELAARLNHARRDARREVATCLPLARVADTLAGSVDHARLCEALGQWLAALSSPPRTPLRPAAPRPVVVLGRRGQLEPLVARLAQRREASNT